MNKNEFLQSLKSRLSGIPEDERQKWLDYYGEMIDDRVEEGLSEQQAVEQIGTVDAVADQIYAETSLPVIIKQKIKPKRALKTWEIVLICVGAPLWAPLLIALLAVIFSLYISLWAIVISFYAAAASVAAAGIACIVLSPYAFGRWGASVGITAIGAGILLIGISIFAFIGCNSLAKALVKLIKKGIVPAIKRLFVKRGVQNEEK